MNTTTNNWIQLIEAAYRVDGSDQDWLHELAQAGSNLLDAPGGVGTVLVKVEPDSIGVEAVGYTSSEHGEAIQSTFATGSTQAMNLMFRAKTRASSLSESVFPLSPETAPMFEQATGFRDATGIIAYTGTGYAVCISAPSNQVGPLPTVAKRRWSQAAAHVGAAARLRKLLTEGGSPEATLTYDGQFIESSESTSSVDAHQRLEQALTHMERARSGRLSPDQTLDLWQGLVYGRWSLLRLPSHKGSRAFIAAWRNVTDALDPRGLTEHEARIASQAGLGLSNQEIAYAFGLSESAIGNAIGRVRRKLGLGNRAEVVNFFSPWGLRARLHQTEFGGESLLLAWQSELDQEAIQLLSDSEREIAIQLASGATYRAIAIARSVAERTVANQVQAIYRKLEVRSRSELVARLMPTQHPTGH
ncbi:MAG: LuxR C-terminal-related transcriptional regulator [Pseudomonadota bacterium]